MRTKERESEREGVRREEAEGKVRKGETDEQTEREAE